MNDLTLDFEQAKSKHLLFKSRLRSILYDIPVEEGPVLSHHECSVGKWIYGHALAAYGHIPEMHELEMVHADIHITARKLVALHKEGKTAEAKKGLSEMELVADKLIGLLGTIEQKIEADPANAYHSATLDFRPNELKDLLRSNEELDRRIKQQIAEAGATEQKYETVLAALTEGIVIQSTDFVIQSVNKSAEQMLGISVQAMKGSTSQDLKFILLAENGEELPEDQNPSRRALKSGVTQINQLVGFKKSDSILWLNVNSHPLIDKETGKPTGVVSSFFDVSALRKADEELKLSLNEQQSLNEELAASAEEQRTAYEQLEFANNSLLSLNEELASLNEELSTANEEISESKTELEDYNKLIEANEGRIRGVLQQTTAGVMILNGADLIVESVNTTMLEIIGKPASIINMPFFKALPELEEQGFFDVILNVYNSGETFIANEAKVAVNKPGGLVDGYYNFSYQAIKDDAGNSTGIIITAAEVTEQVVSRVRVEQAEKSLQLATEAARMGYWYINPETKALMYNTTLANIFGYEGTAPMTFDMAINQVSPEYLPLITEAIDSAIKTGGDYDITYLQRRFNDNKPVWLRSLGKVVEDLSGERSFSGVVMDVTEQVTSSRAIEESEERFRTMAEGTDVMIAVGDENGKAVYFNEAWAQSTGRSIEKLLASGWVDLIHPEDKDRVLKIFTAAFAEAKPWEWEFRMPGVDNGYKWLLARGTPRFRADGSFAGYISSTININERKEDEQRKNDFIGMVSHELKTPLTSLNGYLQVLQSKANKTADAFTISALEKANKQVGKMTTMINGFLNVSRLESGKIHIDHERFDMKELVAEIEDEVVPMTTSHHIIFDPVLTTWINGDREKIGQVITNLISNALKYSAPGTTIQIACVAANGCSQVSVRDEGMGIDKKDIDKLFDRFYRVEGHQMRSIAGFGIGLYLCKEIIDRHNGKIWVESEVGKSSTFYFSIPVID